MTYWTDVNCPDRNAAKMILDSPSELIRMENRKIMMYNDNVIVEEKECGI